MDYNKKDESDILKTINFAVTLPVDFAVFSLLSPYPDAAFYKEGVEKGLFNKKAMTHGCGPLRLFMAQAWIGAVLMSPFLFQGPSMPVSTWRQPALTALFWFGGAAVYVYTLRDGDLSIIGPVAGVKPVFNAMLIALLLRIPVADSFARRKYGIHWVAWDAPRHLYLHTVKSLHIAASGAGFEVAEVTYDSTHSQFVGSELYLRGVPFQQAGLYHAGMPKAAFTAAEWRGFQRATAELNALRDGDTACFYLRPR